MHHVRGNRYIKMVGEPARPLIREALQILHRLELSDSESYDQENHLSRPRLPHELLFAVGGWSGGSPTNSIEAYDARANCWVNVTGKIQNFAQEKPRAYHGVCFKGHSVYIMGWMPNLSNFLLISFKILELKLFQFKYFFFTPI